MKNFSYNKVRAINSLKELLDSSAMLFENKPAFLVKKTEESEYSPISYKQLKSDVDAIGTALLHLGLKDQNIALIAESRYEWAVAYLATVNGTGVIVPVDKELPQTEFENLLVRSKSAAVIFSDKYSGRASLAAEKFDFITHLINMDADEDLSNTLSFKKLILLGNALLTSGDRSFVDSTIDIQKMSILLFTSGTTETSKAAMLSHENLCKNIMATCSMVAILPSDIFLSVLPLHHTYEATCGMLCPLYSGSTIAYCEGLRYITKNMQESKATVMLGVPLIFEAIYKRIWSQTLKTPGMNKKFKFGMSLSNLLRTFGINLTQKLFAPIHQNFGKHMRLFVSGAAAIDPVVAKGFRSIGILFLQGYGLTECSPIVTLNRDVDFKDAAAGISLLNLDVKIDSPNPDGVGAITVKGPSVMLGYYNDPASTAKVLKNDVFYTGDMGYMDRDGFIYITGRKKNVIVTKNGKNIYPEEIELLLNRSKYILESIVYGKDDPQSGDVMLAATIVPDMEIIKDEHGALIESDEFVNGLIKNEVKLVNGMTVGYKFIKKFDLQYTEFCKTTTKKIKRHICNGG